MTEKSAFEFWCWCEIVAAALLFAAAAVVSVLNRLLVKGGVR